MTPPQPRTGGPPGRLFIVATPIGHLDDLSPRARHTLSSVALIACEDTRTTRVLLDHIGAHTPTTSFHDHNERDRASHLLHTLLQGQDVALVSDAGTPCIADPGYRLVAACREAGVEVCPIPGPCAAVAALSAAGLPVHRWSFLGFAPRTSGARQALLKGADGEGTLILYESPQRLLELLADVEAVMGARRLVCVGRELTKHFEEFIRGDVAAVRADLGGRDRVRGECVVMIAPRVEVAAGVEGASVEEVERARALLGVLRAGGCSERTCRDALVVAFGWRKGDAYQFVLQGDGA